jgi:hypothetical protein
MESSEKLPIRINRQQCATKNGCGICCGKKLKSSVTHQQQQLKMYQADADGK